VTQTPIRDGQQHAPPPGDQQPAPGHPPAPKKRHRFRTVADPAFLARRVASVIASTPGGSNSPGPQPRRSRRREVNPGPGSGTGLRGDDASSADHAQSDEGDSVARATAAHSRPIPTSAQEIIETRRPEPSSFAVGDHVVVKDDIGLLRPRVPHGMSGVVAAFGPDGELEVQFANGRVELLDQHKLIAA
jgi:hypothetical protein